MLIQCYVASGPRIPLQQGDDSGVERKAPLRRRLHDGWVCTHGYPRAVGIEEHIRACIFSPKLHRCSYQSTWPLLRRQLRRLLHPPHELAMALSPEDPTNISWTEDRFPTPSNALHRLGPPARTRIEHKIAPAPRCTPDVAATRYAIPEPFYAFIIILLCSPACRTAVARTFAFAYHTRMHTFRIVHSRQRTVCL